MVGKKMIEVVSHFNVLKNYKMYDTLIVSYTREEEFNRIMQAKPYTERSLIYAASWVAHDTVYYVDINGRASKYVILDDEDAIA